MSRPYRQFSKEFKREAIRLAEASEQPVTQVARELGIRVNQIYKWKQQLETQGNDSFPGKGKQPAASATLAQLRKENERLRVENEILKKAARYFASQLE